LYNPEQESMQKEYFDLLNSALKSQEKCLPRMLVDLNVLDDNIQSLNQIIHPDNDIRLVVKSLPSIELLKHLMKNLNTNKLMVFHLPFLIQCFEELDYSEILLGKPMPAKNALYFHEYINSSGRDSFQRLQWIVDTNQRLDDYLNVTDRLNAKLKVNLELAL